MKCPHCGQEHPDTTKFCPETGKQMEPQGLFCTNPDCDFSEQLPLSAKYCPNCGRELQPKADFSKACSSNNRQSIPNSNRQMDIMKFIRNFRNRTIRDLVADMKYVTFTYDSEEFLYNIEDFTFRAKSSFSPILGVGTLNRTSIDKVFAELTGMDISRLEDPIDYIYEKLRIESNLKKISDEHNLLFVIWHKLIVVLGKSEDRVLVLYLMPNYTCSRCKSADSIVFVGDGDKVSCTICGAEWDFDLENLHSTVENIPIVNPIQKEIEDIFNDQKIFEPEVLNFPHFVKTSNISPHVEAVSQLFYKERGCSLSKQCTQTIREIIDDKLNKSSDNVYSIDLEFPVVLKRNISGEIIHSTTFKCVISPDMVPIEYRKGEIIERIDSDYYDMANYNNRLLIIKKDGKYGVATGGFLEKWLVLPCVFDEIQCRDEVYYLIKSGQRGLLFMIAGAYRNHDIFKYFPPRFQFISEDMDGICILGNNRKSKIWLNKEGDIYKYSNGYEKFYLYKDLWLTHSEYFRAKSL